MLSYRHAYHAGNHADVLKHLTLVALLQSFAKKPAPFCYLESHAGKGVYDLSDAMASKNAEFQSGIQNLWQSQLHDPLLLTYRDLVRAAQTQHNTADLKIYPGSPAIAQALCREQDKLVLMELHNQEIQLLRQNFKGDSRIHIHHRDGFEGLQALVPPTPRRGFALIDPAYEVKKDYDTVVRTVEAMLRKWQSGTFAIWLPLLARARDHSEQVQRGITRGPAEKVLWLELSVAEQEENSGMYGSAMLVINPPWQVDTDLNRSLLAVAPLLAPGRNSAVRVRWLKGGP